MVNLRNERVIEELRGWIVGCHARVFNNQA